MKVLIENYRGFDIHFNTDLSKFVTSITDEDDKSSNSFKAVKAEIDAYKKENANFEPFYVRYIPSPYNKALRKVLGIRKDERFTVEGEDGKLEQISEYYENEYMLYLPENDEIFTALAKVEAELAEISSNYLQRMRELKSKLKVITLRDHKKTLNL